MIAKTATQQSFSPRGILEIITLVARMIDKLDYTNWNDALFSCLNVSP
jgi:hypothetical protein